MRIGTKLFLTYLLLLGLFGIATAVGLPRWVERTVVQVEQDRLQTAVDWAASRFRRRPGPSPALDTILTDDETMAVVGAKGKILLATSSEYLDVELPTEVMNVLHKEIPLSPRTYDLDEIGEVLIAGAALRHDDARADGAFLVVIREARVISKMAVPITRRLLGFTVLMICLALAIAGAVSRGMVRRLKATGEAARALAEGDLQQRAPSTGADEITDMAAHFNHMADRLEALVAGLRRSEQSRKDLLVTVSHELRTPLTSIQGFAEALRDGVVKTDDRREHYVGLIASEASRLSRLISDLFDVSRLEAGQLDLQLAQLRLTDWLVGVAEKYQPIAERQGVELALTITPDAELARVHADHDRLTQVLGNLADNALRYSPPESRLTFAAAVNGDTVTISVTDQGPGLTLAESGRVFDRFYQGAAPSAGKGGAGLGLAIVKSLVEAHGGQVGVTSQPGQGATFWFSLPLSR